MDDKVNWNGKTCSSVGLKFFFLAALNFFVMVSVFLNVQANYVGKLENGKVFDSSYNRGRPLSFRIGVGEVCECLVLCFLTLSRF